MNVLIVAAGDAERVTTWSGVPNHFVRELRQEGHTVRCIDLSRVSYIVPIRILFNRVIRKILRLFRWIPFEVTKLGIWLAHIWFAREIKRFGDADIIFCFSFCVDATGIGKPVVLIHDWTNGYMQKMFHCREMTFFEKMGDMNQFRVMQAARKVVCLYPKAAEYIRNYVGDRVRYYCNPVNIEKEIDFTERVKNGVLSKHILVIGGSTYLSNVVCVINAAEKSGLTGIVIDIVGAAPPNLSYSKVTVKCHGYLNKDKKEDCDKYYSLIENSRCLVNVRKGWGGGSSIAEALYCGLPVIVGDYPDIVGMYGSDECFGYYCKQENVDALACSIKKMFDLSNEQYVRMCQCAVTKTKSCTYKNLIASILSDVK